MIFRKLIRVGNFNSKLSNENQPWQDRYCLHSYKYSRQQILLNYTQMATILETVFQLLLVFQQLLADKVSHQIQTASFIIPHGFQFWINIQSIQFINHCNINIWIKFFKLHF